MGIQDTSPRQVSILERCNQDEHQHLVGSGRCHLLVPCRQGKGGGGAGGDAGVRDRLDRRRLKLLLSSALLRILSESIGVSRDVHLGSGRPACIYPQPSRAGSDHEVDTRQWGVGSSNLDRRSFGTWLRWVELG